MDNKIQFDPKDQNTISLLTEIGFQPENLSSGVIRQMNYFPDLRFLPLMFLAWSPGETTMTPGELDYYLSPEEARQHLEELETAKSWGLTQFQYRNIFRTGLCPGTGEIKGSYMDDEPLEKAAVAMINNIHLRNNAYDYNMAKAGEGVAFTTCRYDPALPVQILRGIYFIHGIPEQLEETRSAVTTILNKDGDVVQSTGSAVRMSAQGHFVTAHHVIYDEKGKMKNGSVFDGDIVPIRPDQVLYHDEDRDIVIFRIPEVHNRSHLVPFARTPQVGEQVWISGYPETSGQGRMQVSLFSTGEVTEVGQDTFQISAKAYHGFSGGAILDEKGNFLGVIASVNPGEGFSTGTRADIIPDLLTGEQKKFLRRSVDQDGVFRGMVGAGFGTSLTGEHDGSLRTVISPFQFVMKKPGRYTIEPYVAPEVVLDTGGLGHVGRVTGGVSNRSLSKLGYGLDASAGVNLHGDMVVGAGGRVFVRTSELGMPGLFIEYDRSMGLGGNGVHNLIFGGLCYSLEY